MIGGKSLNVASVATIVIAAMLIAASATTGQLGAPATPSAALASPIASPVASPTEQTNVHDFASVADRVTIRLSDDGFHPSFVQATNGHDLTITLVNDGTRPHGFTIEELDIDELLQPGETRVIVIEDPPLGDFDIISRAPGDDAFEGELVFYI